MLGDRMKLDVGWTKNSSTLLESFATQPSMARTLTPSSTKTSLIPYECLSSALYLYLHLFSPQELIIRDDVVASTIKGFGSPSNSLSFIPLFLLSTSVLAIHPLHQRLPRPKGSSRPKTV